MLQVVDSIAGTITRTYDGLDRLTSEATPQGSVSYTYDAANRRTSMTVAAQPAVNYAYDNANRLLQITQGSSVVTFGYDAAGRRASLTLPNGILVEYAYDAASRVTGITYKQGTTVLGNLTYEYDKAGNRTKIGGTWARSGLPPSVSSTNYNAGNQQTTFGDKALTYDNNGNLTSITDASGTTFYDWNARNQLIGISGPGVNATFVYDGLRRREKKTINGGLTEFLYDGVNPVQETSGATVLANILPGLGIDEFFSRTDVSAGTTSTLLTDALGSALALADTVGAVQTEYTYEPFGKTTVTGISSTSPFQYTGRENDTAGLYYYRARYYHPELQRFVSEDPIQFLGGDVNLYAYVANNPINFTDPFGLDKEKKCGPIPSAPPGVNIDDNIRLAEDLSSAPVDPLFGYGEWLGRVWPGGVWDYKRWGDFEPSGNFNYGATGAAMGIPQDVLLRAAGVVQMVKGPYDPNNGYPWWLPPYGDQPWDQSEIKAGYRYYWCTKN